MDDLSRSTESHDSKEDLVCRITPGDVITYANQTLCDALRTPPEKILHQNLYQFIPAESASQVRSFLARVKEKHGRTMMELPSPLPGGRIRWQRWTAIPIMNDDGTLQEIQTVCREFTDQDLMLSALDAQRELLMKFSNLDDPMQIQTTALQAAVQATSAEQAAFLLFDKKGKLHTVSTCGMDIKSGQQLFAAAGKQLKGETSDSSIAQSKMLEVTSEIPTELRKQHHISSAHLLPLIHSEQCIGAIGLVFSHDTAFPIQVIQLLEILALHSAAAYSVAANQSVLIQKVANLNSVFEMISEMLFLVSVDGLILQINRAVSEKLGYTRDECVGKPFNILQPEQEKSEFSKIIKRLRELREGSFRIPFLTRTGNLLQVEMDLSYGTWEQQEVLIVVCRDISYRMEIEQSEREQRVLASALADVGTILNSSLNLDEVLDRILENVGKVVPNAITNIMSVEGDQAHVIRSRGYETVGTEELLHTHIFEIKKVKNLYKMAYTFQPAVTEDTTKDPNWVPIPESFWVRSFVGAPITFQGKLFGFINCDSDQPGFYNRSHARKLKLLADQAGIAMANATIYNDARQSARQLSLINDLTRVVLSSEDLEKTISKLLDQLKELFHAENVYLTRYKEETRTIFGLASTTSHNSVYANQYSISDEATLTKTCLDKGKAIYIQNLQESELMAERFKRFYDEKSLLALPMITDGKKIGAIIVGFKSFHINTEAENSIGEYAASQIASVLFKIYALKQQRNQSELLAHTNSLVAVLNKVGITVNSAAGKDGVIESLGVELEKLGIHSLIALSDPQTNQQVIRYISRPEVVISSLEHLMDKSLPDFTLPVDDFIQPQGSMKEPRTYFIQDPSTIVTAVLPQELSPFKKRVFEILSINEQTKGILVPLILNQRIIGYLILWGEEIKQVDQQAASIFADQIAAAIDNANLLEKVKLLAVTDDMTGIYNRRGLNEYCTREIEITRRLNKSLSVIMFDIDNFKRVNDQFGHTIGDQVLCELSHRCKKKIREIDIFGRYGGEEFIVMLIETGMKVALDIAERIRKFICDTPIHTDAGDIRITVSLGVVDMSSDTDSFDMLVKRADEALYLAKQKGRNQAACWQPPQGD